MPILNNKKPSNDKTSVGDITGLSSDYYANLPLSPPPVAQPVKSIAPTVKATPTPTPMSTSDKDNIVSTDTVTDNKSTVPNTAGNTVIEHPTQSPITDTAAVTLIPTPTTNNAAQSVESIILRAQSEPIQLDTSNYIDNIEQTVTTEPNQSTESINLNTSDSVESFVVSNVDGDNHTTVRVQIIKDGWLLNSDMDAASKFYRIVLIPNTTDRTQPPATKLQCFDTDVTNNTAIHPIHSWVLNNRVSINSSGTKLTLLVTDKLNTWNFQCATVNELESWIDAFSTVNSLLIKFDTLSSDVVTSEDMEPLSPKSIKLRADTKSLLPRRGSTNSIDIDSNKTDNKSRAQQQAEQRYMKSVKNRMYQKMFHLPSTEELIEDYSCAVSRSILLHGRMYVSANYICFFSNIFSHKTTIVIPVADILHVQSAVAALVFDNSIKIYVQTGQLPMHTHTSIGQSKHSDNDSTTDTTMDEKSDSMNKSPSQSPTNSRTRSESNPATPSSTTTPSHSLNEFASTSTQSSPRSSSKPTTSTSMNNISPVKQSINTTKSVTQRTIHSTNGMLSLPLIDLLETGHTGITQHFFASFITRDHALNLITSLVNARQRAYYEKYGFEVKPVEPNSTLQPHIESKPVESTNESSSHIDENKSSELVGYSVVSDESTPTSNQSTPAHSVALPTLTVPTLETITAPSSIVASKLVLSSGDISGMSNEDIRIAAEQDANHNNTQHTATDTTTNTTPDVAVSIIDAQHNSNTTTHGTIPAIVLDGKQLPTIIPQSEPIDMQPYRPPDTELTDCEWEEVLDVTIALSTQLLYECLFSDTAIFSQIVFQSLKGDTELVYSKWHTAAHNTLLQTRESTFRQILTNPMAPPNTRVYKTQTLLKHPTQWSTIKIESRCLTPDVPIAGDCVMVCDTIVIDSITATSCRVRVALGISFLKRPFKIRPLISTIKSQTKKDIKALWELWYSYVQKLIAEHGAVIQQVAIQHNISMTESTTQQPAIESAVKPPTTTSTTPAIPIVAAQPTVYKQVPIYDPVFEYSNGTVRLTHLVYIFGTLTILLHTFTPCHITNSVVTQALLLCSLFILFYVIQATIQSTNILTQQLLHEIIQIHTHVNTVTQQLNSMHNTKLVVNVQDDYIKSM